MKQCIKCKQMLPKNSFHKRKHISKYTGIVKEYISSFCKPCNTLKALERRQSIPGMYQDMYYGQISSSKHRKHPLPNYTLDELKIWVDLQPNSKELITAWVDSGYDKLLKPSCDRLNDYLPYTLDNLRLVTWEVNCKKSYSDKAQGINTKACKAVDQYSLDDKYIRSFYSLNEAAEHSKSKASNIQRCCINMKGYKTAGGFKWKYPQEVII